MSAKTTTFAAQILNLVLNNLAAANIGDVAGLQPSGVSGVLYISLHTADPGVGGSQNTSEAGYTGYARIPVARDNTWWTVAGASATNAKVIAFPISASGPQTITYAGIGTSLAGAGHLLYRALVVTPAGGLIVNVGITPTIAIGAATVSEA